MTLARAAAFLRARIIFAKLGALILWVCYVGSILLGSGRGTYNLQDQVVCADHLAFYTAAQLVRTGQDDKIYDYEWVAKYQAGMFREGVWTSLEAFRNPPFYALLYTPTAGSSFAASAWTWTAVSLLGVVVGVWWLAGDRPPGFATALAWTFTFYPIFCGVSYGQNSLLSFAVFAATYRLLKADRPFAAGLVAGLLWFKPPLLLGLGVWALIDIRRKWPCALGVVVAGAVLVLGSYPVVPEAWAGFVRTLTGNVRFENFEQWKMHNPLAFWRLLLPASDDPNEDLWLKRVHYALAAVCSLLAVAVFVKLWRAKRDDLPVMFGAAVFLTLIASPHALVYEWALLAVPGILWWAETRRDPDQWFLVYAVAWTILFAGTHFSQLQTWVSPVVVQVSVPVLGWCYWKAARMLSKNGNADDAGSEPRG